MKEMAVVWLPYANVTNSVQALSDDDLIEQIRQCELLVQMLAEEATDSRLLVVQMWRGYETCVVTYLLQACQEFDRRAPRWKHLTLALVRRVWLRAEGVGWPRGKPMPRWFGSRLVHMSHQSQLMRRRPTHYARQWPTVPLDMPLLWPCNTPNRFEFEVRVSRADQQRLLARELVLRTKTTDGRMEGIKVS